ncbi:MAG: phosphatase PAP2 family protein [Bacillota bacterium]
MWIYSSHLTMAAASVSSLLVLLWLATRRNPLIVLWHAIRYVFAEHRAMGLVALAYAMVAVNLLQVRLETRLSQTVTWDFTAAVSQVGTEFLLLLQRLEWPPLTHLLTFVYVILFTMLMLGSMIFYAAQRDLAALKNHVISYWVNYLVALPFYFWFPVNEAWAGGKGVQFLIPKIFPGFEQVVRPHSDLDNCFPSLHTSLALTYALVAWRHGYRRLAIVLSVAAGLVMLSTLYLGVHWVLDMIFGSVLALFASGYLTMPSPAGAEGRLRTNP